MSVPEKKRNRIGFWTNPKVKEFFDKLCQHSEVIKTTIDWKKFRALDKKNRFEMYDNAYLSLMVLRRKRESDGICTKCGKYKAMEEKTICKKCYKISHDRYLERE